MIFKQIFINTNNMRATVFFAKNNDGVKLSFTRLSLKKALENINKKSDGNEFTIIDSIVVKKPKVVIDFISNHISSNKIINSDLYNISDIEIKEIICYTRDIFSIKKTKNFNEEYDSNSEMTSVSDETTEMKSSSVETTEKKSSSVETTEMKSACDSVSVKTTEMKSSSVETTEMKSSCVETTEMKSSYEPKSKYFLVKEYFILYSTAFIIYSIYQYTKSNNWLSN